METLYAYQNQLIQATKFTFTRKFNEEVEWSERLIGVTGARGVGKTTCLLQYLRDNNVCEDKTKLYVSFDNITNPYSSIIELAQEFHKRGGKQLFIDEIHKYQNWAIELKNIYDMMPNLQVVFSGSSMLLLYLGEVDLSRRAVMYKLKGLSFREFLQIQTNQVFPIISLEEILNNHEKLALEITSKVKPLQYFSDYLKYGYYPFYLQSLNTYSIKLQSVISYILENEIPIVANLDIRNVFKIRKMLQIISENVPFEPNISKLALALDLNRNTLLHYLQLLKTAEIIDCMYSAGGFYSKMTKPEKILLSHPNLSYCLSMGQVNIGSVRESFFVNQLSNNHKVELAKKGDFVVNEKLTFEVGGKNKGKSQIAGVDNAYLVVDDIEIGYENKIPMWLFGFLY